MSCNKGIVILQHPHWAKKIVVYTATSTLTQQPLHCSIHIKKLLFCTETVNTGAFLLSLLRLFTVQRLRWRITVYTARFTLTKHFLHCSIHIHKNTHIYVYMYILEHSHWKNCVHTAASTQTKTISALQHPHWQSHCFYCNIHTDGLVAFMLKQQWVPCSIHAGADRLFFPSGCRLLRLNSDRL